MKIIKIEEKEEKIEEEKMKMKKLKPKREVIKMNEWKKNLLFYFCFVLFGFS